MSKDTENARFLWPGPLAHSIHMKLLGFLSQELVMARRRNVEEAQVR